MDERKNADAAGYRGIRAFVSAGINLVSDRQQEFEQQYKSTEESIKAGRARMEEMRARKRVGR